MIQRKRDIGIVQVRQNGYYDMVIEATDEMMDEIRKKPYITMVQRGDIPGRYWIAFSPLYDYAEIINDLDELAKPVEIPDIFKEEDYYEDYSI